MDAFSVSIANGLSEPGMSRPRMCVIAGVYAAFQFAMPVLGWLCVTRIVETFLAIEPFIPWIAMILLAAIGGKMLLEGLHRDSDSDVSEEHAAGYRIGAGVLFAQGVATSIDALSVGFTLAKYSGAAACVSAAIIGAVTFGICLAGLAFGRFFGDHFSDRASIAGGLILIGIGIEILIRSFL